MSKTERLPSPTLELDLQSGLSLTSIINSQQSTPRSITRTLLDFFMTSVQDIKPNSDKKSDLDSKSDFSSYLNEVSVELNHAKRRLSKRSEGSILDVMEEQDIAKCYNDIPYVYFDKDLRLNMENYGDKDKMRQEQEDLNEYLDLVEINLFSQVTHKFNDFYQALVNFEDLEIMVEDNVARLRIVRGNIPLLQKNFFEKAAAVQRTIQLRTNKETLLRHLTMMRSLRKLPPTIKTILQSPLPHQSLPLLSTGKSMYQIVKGIHCMKIVGDALENSDNVIKHSLYKSFSDKIFLYLSTPLNPPYLQHFQQLPSNPSSSNANSSVLEDWVHEQETGRVEIINVPKTEEELVATIVESYDMVDFVSNSRIRSKLVEHIKIITKEFFEELKVFLNSTRVMVLVSTAPSSSTESLSLPELLDGVNMGSFLKIMNVYQQMFKTVTLRLLSILQLMYSRVSEDQKSHMKSIPILEQLLYILSSVVKIVCEETILYMATKKLPKETTIYEFQTYLSPLMSWIKHCESILDSDIFINKSSIHSFNTPEYRSRLSALVEPLKQSKDKLEDAFMTNLHMTVISSELKVELEKEPWISVEDIPYSYLLILNYIFNKNEGLHDANTSVNESFLGQSTNRRQRNRVIGQPISNKPPTSNRTIHDIKLVKNAIILDQKRYKTTISFLLFVEVLEEYLKIQQVFTDKKAEMTMRIGDISTYFSSYSTQLIVCAGALKLNVIKTKNITVKHLCLLWGNLELLSHMLIAQELPELRKIIQQISRHADDVLKKMSSIICTRVESELTTIYKQGLVGEAPTQQTQNIVNSQRQMMEIMEEYLDEHAIKEVMAKSVNLVLKKYFEYLEERGDRGREEGIYYLEQMRMLEISFEKEVDIMKRMVKGEERS